MKSLHTPPCTLCNTWKALWGVRHDDGKKSIDKQIHYIAALLDDHRRYENNATHYDRHRCDQTGEFANFNLNQTS